MCEIACLKIIYSEMSMNEGVITSILAAKNKTRLFFSFVKKEQLYLVSEIVR